MHHAKVVDGTSVRAPTRPASQLLRSKLGLRFRLRGKQSKPASYHKPQARPRCAHIYDNGTQCEKEGQRRCQGPDGTLYCDAHFKVAPSARLAVCALSDFDDANTQSHRGGNLEHFCKQCAAINFEEELTGTPKHFSICCNNGKLKHIPALQQAPDELLLLLTGMGRRTKDVLDNIRYYNGAFSFVSYGSGLFNVLPSGYGRGPPVLKVHGTTYHMAGQLFPDDPENAQYAQIYLYDHREAVQHRTARADELLEADVNDLQTMLDRECPYVRLYRHMRTLIEGGPAPTVQLGFKAQTDGADMRRFNHPQAFEPAVVFVGNEGEPPSNRDIVIWPREEPVHRVSELCEHVDPLAYPLLFPRGEPGWSSTLRRCPEFQTAAYTRVTPIQFYSHRLMVRVPSEVLDGVRVPLDASDNTPLSALPHAAGMLFQQYVCDIYSRAEAQRLNWIRLNQKTLRAEMYQGLYDAVQNTAAGCEVPQIGTRMVLPSTYAGCPRALQQNYYDAMRIVCRYGKPDYFITCTANPQWEEITANLPPG